jgi:hypothetical protein
MWDSIVPAIPLTIPHDRKDGTGNTGNTARSTPAPIPSGAVLTVTILNENAADSRRPDTPRNQPWPVELDLSATLTRADGVMSQQIKNVPFTRSFDFPVSNSAVWNQWSGLQQWIAFDRQQPSCLRRPLQVMPASAYHLRQTTPFTRTVTGDSHDRETSSLPLL